MGGRKAERRFQDRTGGGQGAFTLIELLVVISIVALLTALLVPCLRRVRKVARATVCRAHLRQYGFGFAEYASEHDGRMFGPGAVQDDPDGDGKAWFRIAMRAQKPRDGKDIIDTFGCPETTVWQGKVMNRDGRYKHKYSPYSLNDWVIDAPVGYTIGYDGPDKPDGRFWRNVSTPRSPGHVPLMLDSLVWFYRLQPSEEGAPPPEDPRESELTGSPMGAFCTTRHGPFVNGLFMDWSVRPVGLKELWTLKWHRQYDTCGPWTKAGGRKPGDWPQWMRVFRDY